MLCEGFRRVFALAPKCESRCGGVILKLAVESVGPTTPSEIVEVHWSEAVLLSGM